MMIKAEIIPEWQNKVWIKIDRVDGDLIHQTQGGGSMHPIQDDEIEPIMLACKEYLEKIDE